MEGIVAKEKTIPYLPGRKSPISTPLYWEKVEPSINPENFNLKTISKRFKEMDDLFAPVLYEKQRIDEALEILQRDFPTVK
ncbi:hypothetical protein BBF96_07295 [Anoxybacter fermentans]|uniref:Uncharacterized protein n=1 Tax=Anoxybacter fermentans TaxID=1323375 RepID=A0A3S9SY03_9FIRM|nr:hypothetical protein [Anoxybacter fermentans]AZR73207.1 hypothetical protein BBF96_07295 [Anoxybacter fermentans]